MFLQYCESVRTLNMYMEKVWIKSYLQLQIQLQVNLYLQVLHAKSSRYRA